MLDAARLDRLTLRLSTGLLAASLAVVLGVALGLARYAYPKADELYRTGRVRYLGVPASVQVEYTTWSGRWAGTGTSYVLGATLNLESAYGWLLIAVAAATPVAAYALLGAVFGTGLSRGHRALLSIAYFALYWTGLPSAPDGFYWLTGSLENQLPIALGMAVVAGLLRSGAWSRSWRVATTGVFAVVAATLVAFHELHGLLFILTLAAGSSVAFLIHHPARWAWATVTIAAVVGLAIVAAAPGNERRVASIPVHVREPMLQNAARWLSMYADWVLDPRLLAATVCVLAAPSFHLTIPGCLSDRRRLWAVAIPMTSVLTLATATAVIWWANAGLAPGRTRSALYMVFLVAWFTSVFVLLAGLRSGTSLSLPAPIRLALVAYFGLALLWSDNFRTAVNDLRGPARAYHWSVRRRHEMIRAAVARGERHIRVAPLPVIPASFAYDAELVEAGSTAANAYVNDHAALYFGAVSVALSSSVAGR